MRSVPERERRVRQQGEREGYVRKGMEGAGSEEGTGITQVAAGAGRLRRALTRRGEDETRVKAGSK